jgi:hypothetical protein
MNLYYDKLKNIYINNKVYIEDDELILFNNCIKKDICWNTELIKIFGADWNIVSFPYIGENYKNKLLCIGLNLNEYGGYYALNDLITSGKNNVIKSLLSHKRRMNFGNKNYGGTLLFHRMAIYANIVLGNTTLEDKKVLSKNNIFIGNDFIQLVEIYKEIAFLEAIKCSPYNEKNSKPFENMYNTCFECFLSNEIKILEPSNIIVFDKKISDIIKYKFNYKANLLGKNVEYYNISLNNISTNVYRIIHPQAINGGSSISNIYELQILFNKIKSDFA